MIWPNFFIVGAPKCGTTALHTYLTRHPDIFLPRRKEPRFFASDLDSGSERDGRYFVRDEPAYLQLFAPAAHVTRRGEATALYLFSSVAARRISTTCPDAKIIIMVRDPVELMYSFHSERLFNGNEDITDFAEAIGAEPERRAGKRIPARTIVPEALQYRQLATLSPQIERYLASFKRTSLLFIVFDDFVRDTPGVYRDVLRFLEVDPSFTPDFAVHNANKAVRNYAARNIVRRPPEFLRVAARAVVPALVRQKLKQRVKRFNVRVTARPSMDPALRRQLQLEFAPEVKRLSETLQRDLSAWSEP